MIVKEALSYYAHHNSRVFGIFLDASDAFDEVQYTKFFSLLKRNIPPHIVRTMLNIYTGQQVRVLWNGVYSCNFSVRNGVKQRGIISPMLFCIYLDNVLAKLQSS
jgi:hypothetical protein